jgi:hypothetical protein
MVLLLGSTEDLCLRAVRDALAARGANGEISASPFAQPVRTSWTFGGASVANRVSLESRDLEIEGVLVRGRGTYAPDEPTQWWPEDLAYLRSEAEAALLAWLTALPCRVIDRQPAWLWYGMRHPVIAWGSLLRSCDLPPLDMVITDCPEDITDFLAAYGGAALEPMGGCGRGLVASKSLPYVLDLARSTPLRLTAPHDGAARVCRAGASIVWDGCPPPDRDALDERIRAFTGLAGLEHVELIVTMARPARVVDVEPLSRFERFGAEAQSAIAESLAASLLGDMP